MIAASFPITWSPTWFTTSGMTGFTLPGMIDEPFCSSGRRSSERPARGPEPISARSLAILIIETATTLSAPESSTSESRLAWASKGSRGAEISMPMSFETSARTFSANSGCVLRPVPVAVPPRGSWPTRPRVARTRSAPSSICAAYPANSWPSVTGTASIRCVRPVFTMSSNSVALAASVFASPSIAGSRSSFTSPSAAMWTADGKTSFDDWPMFTWSLRWTPSPARFAMTSFAFMFDEVPEPVWKTSTGN